MAQTCRYSGNAGLYYDLGVSSGQRCAVDRIAACFITNYHLSVLRNNLDISIKTNVILDGTWSLAQKTAKGIILRLFHKRGIIEII